MRQTRIRLCWYDLGVRPPTAFISSPQSKVLSNDNDLDSSQPPIVR